MAHADINVEVSYAQPEHAVVKNYRLPVPATVEDALRVARADPDFAGVNLDESAVGVFGRVTALSQILREGDRVEIYRPLAADPKSARRERVNAARKRR